MCQYSSIYRQGHHLRQTTIMHIFMPIIIHLCLSFFHYILSLLDLILMCMSFGFLHSTCKDLHGIKHLHIISSKWLVSYSCCHLIHQNPLIKGIYAHFQFIRSICLGIVSSQFICKLLSFS